MQENVNMEKNIGKEKIFNGKSYPENINYFLIPKRYRKAKEVTNRFIQEIKKIILIHPLT
jgi:hypothetical protein